MWHKGATTLARLLLALNQPRAALRVVAEFKPRGAQGVFPIHLRRLADVEAKGQAQLTGEEIEQDGYPLIDAVRQALREATC